MPARNTSYKLRKLPAQLRTELDRKLVEGNFTDYRGLARWLSENGCEISFEAVHKYGQKLEQRLELLRTATAQAKAVVEAAPDEEQINGALMRLVQQNLFAVLVELEPRDITGASVAALARSVASLGRAAVAQREYARGVRGGGKAETQTGEAGSDGPASGEGRGGLTAEAREEIKRALLAIAE